MEKYYSYVHHFFVATFFILLGLTRATVIVEHPVDVETAPNEWVQFNCTVTPCNDTVSWFIAGRSGAIKKNNTVPGLVIRRGFSRCTLSNQSTHFFEVQATEALNNSAFYCVAYQGSRTTSVRRHGDDGRRFSKSALLKVNTTTTPSLTSTCMTETTPVPSPSCTVQGRTFTEIITMTSTVTVSVTPTPTKFPNSGPTACAHMQNSSSQAAYVKAAILAGLGIAASILLL